MDFQQNTQPEIQNEPDPMPDRQTPELTAPPKGNEQEIAPVGQPPYQETPTGNMPSGNTGSYNNNPYNHNPYENGSQYRNDSPAQDQQPYGRPGNSPYQVRPPYGNDGATPYQNNSLQNGNPYQNNIPNPNGNPYQNGAPNPNGNPYRNSNPYQNNTPYGSNGYYDRAAYQMPYAEPGSNLAGAAMVLGILSIISSFTFTVYPAFILGSIAVMLGLLSKGTRTKLLSKARTGVICATIGLILNTTFVTSCTVLFFTNAEVREEVNRTFEQQYGVTFDEMWEEIMEDSGF